VIWIDVDGARLEARMWGPPPDRAPTLVFLHEGLGSAEGWSDAPARLAEATGCGALAWSREGYGRSQALRQPFGVHFMHREADRLTEVLEATGVQDPLLVGHSDGASIALIAAGRGLGVRAVVVEAPHVIVEDCTVEAIRDAAARFDEGTLRERLARQHGENTESLFRAWSAVWLGPRFRAWSIEEFLPDIRRPLLAIMGDADPYGTYRQLDLLEARCRGPVQQMRLAGCRHTPHRQRAEIVLPAVAAFVRRVLEAPRPA
jgi:pimeloyl-ACP methyl ester carboxylesterase